MFMSLQKAAIVLATLVGVSVASSAEAQTFTFSGTSSGCFGTGCTPTMASTSPVGNTSIAYVGTAFSGQTSMGQLSIGGLFNNFGMFTVVPGNASLNNQPFTLGVNFTVPSSAMPHGTSFSALVTGSVTLIAGGYHIDFDNTARNFTFTTSSGGPGVFSLTINDLDVFPSQANAVSGTIFAMAVPGPIAGAGIPALVLGLVGFFHFRRRGEIESV